MLSCKFVSGIAATALLATPGVFSLPTSGWAQIDEMVVTARKREEILQDIPIAVTAFNLQDISRKSIDTVEDLGMLSSSIQFDQAAAFDSIKITARGLSPTLGRQNIAIMIDGIDASSESIAQSGAGATYNNRMLDLERVEIVKGPQSALFGRSAFNGAIQYVTRDPSDEFEVEIEGEAGEFDRYETKLGFSGPITDSLGFRVNANWWDEEGFYRNERTGDKVGGTEGWGISGKLKWEPTDTLSFELRADYSDQEDEPSATVIVPANVVTAVPAASCVDQGGAGSVFNCTTIRPGFLPPATASLFEAFLNPNGVPLEPGPITASNTPLTAYTGSLAHEGLVTQFRGEIPDMGDLGGVFLSPDPRTGKDFPGLEADHLRVSLIGEWEMDFGTITSWSSYYDGKTHAVQDWQSAGDLSLCGQFIDPITLTPTSPGAGDACVLSYADNTHELDQWSQELRFASTWDHWQQLTLGGLRWYEDRDFFDKGIILRARSIECIIESSGPNIAPGAPCGIFSAPITGVRFQEAIDARRLAFGGLLDQQTASREVFHWSGYTLAETDLNRMFDDVFSADFLPGQWSLIAEARWNHETTKINGLDSSSSGSFGAGICGGGPIFSTVDVGGTPPGEPRGQNPCSGFFVDDPFATGGPPLVPVTTANFATPLCNFTDAELAEIAAGRSGDEDLFALIKNCDGDPQAPRKFGEITNNWWTGKLTLQWEPNDDMLWYFSHAWASKPGGFSTTALGSAGFQPTSDRFVAEKMRVYELGMKTSWFGNTLQVNGAGFFQDFSDKQVITQLVVANPLVSGDFGTVPLTVNASAAEVWGGELEVLWAPDWQDPLFNGSAVFSGSYTYLDAKYTDFVLRNFSGASIAVVGNCTPDLLVQSPPSGPDLLVPTCLVDRSGNRMEDAPKHAANMSVSYVAPLYNTDFSWFIDMDTQYTGKRFIEDTQAAFVGNWWNSNLRIGIENDRYEFLFFVNNLFDGDGIQRASTIPGLSCCFNFVHMRDLDAGFTDAGRGGPAFNSSNYIATLRPPRHIGFRASARF